MEAPLTKDEKTLIGSAVREVEEALNGALLVLPGERLPGVRKALLQARGDIREALGEART
jgi:hypothetical protein